MKSLFHKQPFDTDMHECILAAKVTLYILHICVYTCVCRTTLTRCLFCFDLSFLIVINISLEPSCHATNWMVTSWRVKHFFTTIKKYILEGWDTTQKPNTSGKIISLYIGSGSRYIYIYIYLLYKPWIWEYPSIATPLLLGSCAKKTHTPHHHGEIIETFSPGIFE